MNILYIASVRIPNEKASGLAIMRQCDAFTACGHRVTLLKPNRKNHIKEGPFEYYGMPHNFLIKTMYSINFVEQMGMLGFYLARLSQMCMSTFFLLLNFKKYDTVYARDPWMLILPSLFYSRKKIVWEAHQKQEHPLIIKMAKRVTKIVCISEGLINFYKTVTLRNDLLLEPSGVELRQFKNVPDKFAIRNDIEVPGDANIVAYIGKYSTMGEGKGVEELIQAFKDAYERERTLFLLIVGLESGEKENVEKLCKRFDIPESRFKLIPLVQNKFAYYVKAADILIVNYPSTEHFRFFMSPTKLFAYMAGKKTIIASDLPTIRSIVDDQMVFFIDNNSKESLANAIILAIHSPNTMRAEMIERAYKKVLTYTWEERARRILNSLL